MRVRTARAYGYGEDLGRRTSSSRTRGFGLRRRLGPVEARGEDFARAKVLGLVPISCPPVASLKLD